MSDDLVFGPEYDEEDMQTQLHQYEVIGGIQLIEKTETGKLGYIATMNGVDLENDSAELSDSQILFYNICELISEYLNSSEN